MGIASDLRQSVLQAAMQGKLTTQKAEDGDARDLLLAIREEKEKLVKEKKIKKEKPLAPITDEEISFDIPENWVWCKFGDIVLSLTDGAHKTPHYTASGIPFISVKDLSDGFVNFENTKFISPAEHKELAKRCNPQKSDILLTKVGTTGIPVVIDTEQEFSLFVSVALLKLPSCISPIFLKYIILSPVVQKQCKEHTRGVGNKNWVLSDIRNTIFPLPPLPEQRRIVARVDALMKEIDKLEQTEKELEAIKAAFPGDMKASLLQAAMQGKLTEQKAEDGDARDLLREIRAEKEKLVKEKKGKKEKPLAPIGEDEIPFDIPDNWVWCRLGDLGKSYGTDSFADGPFGSNLKKEHQITNPEVRIIQLSNIGENGWRDENRRYTSFEHLKTIARCEVQPGDFVIAKMMPAGRTIEVPNLGTKICLGSDAVKFSPHHMLDKKYLLIAMHSDAFLGQVYEEAHGITRVRTSLNKLKGYIIPLPPLAEQHRIVEKLDQLLPLCDSLSEH